jgi:hypothetical protein
MDSQRRWIGYDTFKLIIAIILLIIFILLLLQASPETSVAPQNPPAVAAANTNTPAPSLTATSAPTNTLAPSATLAPSPTPEATATPAPTATLEPTATQAAKPTATPEAPSAAANCPVAQPSRLKAGMKVSVVSSLNFRAQGDINAELLHTNPPKTALEIVGGPVCQPVGTGAYLWWNVKQADGATGWSAEAPLNGAYYFLEPAP